MKMMKEELILNGLFRDFVSAIARDDTTLGKDGLVSWSVGQLVSLKYALVLWGIMENPEIFFISDLKEINMMIC